MNDNLIKVFESEGVGRVWLQDKLEEEDIPYIIDYENYLVMRKARLMQHIFVDKSYELSVKRFIDEYSSTDFSIHDDDELLIDFDNELPQISCPACGEIIDLDYPKCPFCKYDL